MRFYDCITEFIFVEDEPRRSDIIFVPGGSYPDAAEHAAGLYRAGYAPYIMPSGKYGILKGRFVAPEGERLAEEHNGNLTGQIETLKAEGDKRRTAEEPGEKGSVRETKTGNYETECDYLCDILRRCGVPDQAILREDQATFTYENAIYSRKRAEELGLQIRRAILCCQAFHARRSLMYYQEQFPDTEFLVCPVVTKGISRENWHQTRQGIDRVLGELERCGGQFHEIMYGKLAES